MDLLLLAKLFVAPTFVVVVTLVGRRLGPSVAGMLAAFPAVAGPILALMIAEHGVEFGAHAALTGAVGAGTTMLFTLVYTKLSERMGPLPSVVFSYASFGAFTYLLQYLPVGLVPAIVVPALTWVFVLALFPVPDAQLPIIKPSRWDLPARALTTMILVVAITGVAEVAGPTLAGLIAPAPVATAVLAVFMHRQVGPDGVAILLRSLTRGLASFSTFFIACGLLLGRVNVVLAFAASLLTALVVQAIVLRFGIGAPRRLAIEH